MTRLESAPLTFASVDGFAFAADRGRLYGYTPKSTLIAGALGPLLELTQLAADGLLPVPDRAPWLALDGVSSFYAALKSTQSHWVCPNSGRLGFLRMEALPPGEDSAWTTFGLATQQAAVAVGLPRSVAVQLVGSIGEMYSNIYEHSGAPATGLVAFKAEPAAFEFVAADRGVGVLKTLKTCPEYECLSDHGDALRLTLTDGVSRHGSRSSHGKGFRPLFVGLANLSGLLRFRSGNHALTIDGDNPTLVTAKPAEKPPISGLFISVACRLDRPTASKKGQL